MKMLRIDAKSESEMTSVGSYSPTSKRAYYVQSPTTATWSPLESPSHSSYARHSRTSSASRFSDCHVNYKQQHHDEHYNDNEEEEESEETYHRRLACVYFLFLPLMIFGFLCLVLWIASIPFVPRLSLHSLTVHRFELGEGSDLTGVPTMLATINCSVRMSVYNPATFFTIHVTTSPITLFYSHIALAKGQLKKYHQPRKSHRAVIANVQGIKVPLYGAGTSLARLDNDDKVPVELVFEVQSKGRVVGKLVESTHKRRITCSLAINSRLAKPFIFNRNSCLFV